MIASCPPVAISLTVVMSRHALGMQFSNEAFLQRAWVGAFHMVSYDWVGMGGGALLL